MVSFSTILLVSCAHARSITYDTKVTDLSKYGGLYYSAYSNLTNSVYLTNNVGKINIETADILQLDPSTLDVSKDIHPPVVNGNETLKYAAYALSVDDEKGHLWVTNTFMGTVAYYNLKDLSLGNQFPQNLVPHSRDICVDTNTNLAWASSARGGIVAAFSSEKIDGPVRQVNITEKLGRNFPVVMGIAIDEESNVLYTAGLMNTDAISIDLKTEEVKAYPLGDVKRPSGVAWDSKRKRLYISNQGTNNTIVLDPQSGKIIKDIDVPGTPLYARYDPSFDVVYVACRTGHSVAVIDAQDYSIITELKVDTPNQIAIGSNGEVFVTDKSSKNLFYRFTPHENSTSDGVIAENSGSTTRDATSAAASASINPESSNKAGGSESSNASGVMAAQTSQSVAQVNVASTLSLSITASVVAIVTLLV